jgi:hypothetical protein
MAPGNFRDSKPHLARDERDEAVHAAIQVRSFATFALYIRPLFISLKAAPKRPDHNEIEDLG